MSLCSAQDYLIALCTLAVESFVSSTLAADCTTSMQALLYLYILSILFQLLRHFGLFLDISPLFM